MSNLPLKTGGIKQANDDMLLGKGQELLTPTYAITNHIKTLRHNSNYEDFAEDFDKVLIATEKLSSMVAHWFSKDSCIEVGVDAKAFSSTVRHDLRTPINAIIGYSEMVLEDLDVETDRSACGTLDIVLGLARKLLNIINDLNYVAELEKANPSQFIASNVADKEKVSPVNNTQKISDDIEKLPLEDEDLDDDDDDDDDEVLDMPISTEDAVVDMGQDLQTPIQTIITYADFLLDLFEKEPAYQEFIEDLNKMIKATNQLSHLITELFAKKNLPDGSMDIEAFSSTVRHDLRTPINAIIGYGEIILEDLDKSEDQEAHLHFQKILTAARKLLTLISDWVYFSKPDKSQSAVAAVENEPADHQSLMDEVASSIRASTDSQEESIIQESSLLVVDDKESNRDLLSRRLGKQGFSVEVAKDGHQALKMVRSQDYDLILLDIIMPGINGYQVLAELKKDKKLKHIPVIMISALDEIDSVVSCIEMGAEDYLQKPFNQIILKAKISASLERKWLRDREFAFVKKLQVEQEKSEKLLLNILPKPVADRLKGGERTIADRFDEVTVLFADLVKFTEMSVGMPAEKLVEKLNEIFFAFDILTELHGLEKIKTIGDAYLLVAGLPTPRPDHVEAVADIALDMQDAITRLNSLNGTNMSIRVGIHTGSVVAGVIGKQKFIYDLWGDAVNVASRMESQGVPGHIQISEAVYQRIEDTFITEKRGPIAVKGKGTMVTYFLRGRKAF